MKADPKTEATVMSVIDQFTEAFGAQDIDSTLALFSPDPDVVFIGTGGDEKCIGLAEIKAELERAFAQSEQSLIQIEWHSVSAEGSVAWVAVDATVLASVNGREVTFPVRLTYVLERRGNRWLILQFHGSLPAAGQKDGEAWPT